MTQPPTARQSTGTEDWPMGRRSRSSLRGADIWDPEAEEAAWTEEEADQADQAEEADPLLEAEAEDP